MDIQQLWERALKGTEILRMRLQELPTFTTAQVPYIFLAESALNRGDTVVRKGQVMIERPSIILPGFSPQFEGFTLDPEHPVSEDALTTFFLVRGVRFPSLKYRHEFSSLDIREASLQRSATHFTQQLTMAEDIHTGLLIGPEDVWQLSVLMLVGAMMARCATGDFKRLLEDWWKRQQGSER